LENTEERKEKEDIKEDSSKKENKEETPEKEVAVSHANVTSQQVNFDVLQALEHPEEMNGCLDFDPIDSFTCCSLQKMLFEKEIKEKIMEDEHWQYVAEDETAKSTFKSRLSELIIETKHSMIKTPQLRLKSRPLARPRVITLADRDELKIIRTYQTIVRGIIQYFCWTNNPSVLTHLSYLA
ncbi:MAG: hypothetical protein Q8835_03455, partial [Sweet potato little leaf phytoplasma]|nr:hypothetical protein [Sweet potato little leaf phytoplasma]